MQTRTLLRGTNVGRSVWGVLLILLAAVGGSPARAADRPAVAGGYRLSGPYTHDNLTIFLLHGPEQLPGPVPITLQEALELKKVVVQEKGAVNELVLDNVSGDEVFIQSGDIVKGGRQDRLIASDFILPPRSGQVGAMCFCVEHDRWQQRGQETVGRFSSSTRQLPSRALKLAGGQLGQFGNLGGQTGWQGGQFGQQGNLGGRMGIQLVCLTGSSGQLGLPAGSFGSAGGQFGLGAGGFGGLGGQLGFAGGSFSSLGGQLGLAGAMGGAGGQFQNLPARAFVSGSFSPAGQSGGQFGMQGDVWREVRVVQRKLTRNLAGDVTSRVSGSSLQLTLESAKVQRAVDAYVRALEPLLGQQSDAIGYIFAINGRINSGEVYGSRALFRKLWPKLLHANAVEALAERRSKPFDAIAADAVVRFLERAEGGEEVAKEVTKRTRLVARETDQALFVETRDPERKSVWIHRSYLAKEQPEAVCFRALVGDDR